MREAVISIATLVGLVGLVAIFNSNGGHRSKRSSEVIEMGGIVDDVDFNNITSEGQFENELDEFVHSLGWGINDLPSILKDDVKVYADGEVLNEDALRRKRKDKTKAFKLTSGNIKKCMENEECHGKAKAMREKWYDNINDLMYQSGAHTEGIWAAGDIQEDEEGNVASYNKNAEALALESATISGNSDIQDLVNGEDMFKGGNVFFGYIMPSGIPLDSEKGGYRRDFNRYNKFFKAFIEKFVQPYVEKQNHVAIWVGREDRKVAWTTKQPIKYTSRRFPMARIIKLMSNPNPSAAQPTLTRSIASLENMVGTYGSTHSDIRDCFVLWIHANMPSDAQQLLDPSMTDRIMELNKRCSIQHIWVGVQSDAQNEAVTSLQQYLQPEQKSKTTYESSWRNWHVMRSAKEFLGDAGSADEFNFMNRAYRNMAIDRVRAKCLSVTSSYNFEAADEDYFTPTDAPAATVGDAAFEYTGDTAAPDAEEKELAEEFTEDFTTNEAPNWACCGIGMNGVKYNSNAKSCCDDGSVAAYGSDGQDGCIY